MGAMEPGMITSIEPGSTGPANGACRIENLVLNVLQDAPRTAPLARCCALRP